jgi:hypothetical protein
MKLEPPPSLRDMIEIAVDAEEAEGKLTGTKLSKGEVVDVSSVNSIQKACCNS